MSFDDSIYTHVITTPSKIYLAHSDGCAKGDNSFWIVGTFSVVALKVLSWDEMAGSPTCALWPYFDMNNKQVTKAT